MAEVLKWSSIKTKIKNLPENEMVALIKELYSLNKECENFLKSKFDPCTGIEEYREIIARYMHPNIESRSEKISLVKAKKAISDYSKSTKDLRGTVDLMMEYVERGHDFLLDYGDAYEQFYDSLVSMFRRIIQKLSKNEDLVPHYYNRLKKIAHESCSFGWGYDEIDNMFSDFDEDLNLNNSNLNLNLKKENFKSNHQTSEI